MYSYKQVIDPITGELSTRTILRSDGVWIPFDPANTDYQKFKVDVMEGAELQDAEGNEMTPDEAVAFISNLPE